MKRVSVAWDQVCRCSRPAPSGRSYLRRQHCLSCNGFIVLRMEVRRLDREERERELALFRERFGGIINTEMGLPHE